MPSSEPLHRFCCANCQAQIDVAAPRAQRMEPVDCPRCGHPIPMLASGQAVAQQRPVPPPPPTGARVAPSKIIAMGSLLRKPWMIAAACCGVLLLGGTVTVIKLTFFSPNSGSDQPPNSEKLLAEMIALERDEVQKLESQLALEAKRLDEAQKQDESSEQEFQRAVHEMQPLKARRNQLTTPPWNRSGVES